MNKLLKITGCISLLFILFLLFNLSCQASTLSTHLDVARIISEHVDSSTEAFLISLCLHPIMDNVDYEYCISNIKDNEDFVLLEVCFSIIQIYQIIKELNPKKQKIMIYAVIGAVLFDILEIQGYLNGKSPIFSWHYGDPDRRINSKIETMTLSIVTNIYSLRF